ncbi:hypothetical protein DFP72DRAFT_855709 [Ephemerocybe angulata]|uniref:Uncharacterized protein n=1 Tax=Ephemerocybe angulata TaxID=980116 RepID=A0A8H6HHZ5_9AGAR|nr:hypothetical protein DFP72DRAFT_855709 [Tulosesus angulatus]
MTVRTCQCQHGVVNSLNMGVAWAAIDRSLGQAFLHNTQKTELEHPACPTLRRGKVSDAWAGLVELGDPQLSTAKRQQRTQVYNSTISHANLERQLGGARGEREAYDEAKRRARRPIRYTLVADSVDGTDTHSQKAQLLEDELSQAQQIADERSRILANLQAEYDELSERNDRLLQSVSEQENMGIVCQELQKQATYLRNLESTNATQSQGGGERREAALGIQVKGYLEALLSSYKAEEAYEDDASRPTVDEAELQHVQSLEALVGGIKLETLENEFSVVSTASKSQVPRDAMEKVENETLVLQTALAEQKGEIQAQLETIDKLEQTLFEL